MDINELVLKYKEGYIDERYFLQYIETVGGIEKIKKKELNKLVKKIPSVLSMPSFLEFYKVVSSNKTEKIILVWTWIAGITSLCSLAAAIISLIISMK